MSTVTDFNFTDIDLFRRLLNDPFTSPLTATITDTAPIPFAPFDHPELIKAIYELKYSKAYRLLGELTDPLSPQEAAAACLCALLGSDRLLNAVLDHCPPIADFQFDGAGCLSSLISTAVRFDLDKKLRILLRRGADPNRGSDCCSPLEIAFAEENYSSLWELLQAPDLKIELTEPILEAWGQLYPLQDAEGSALLFQWCCQTICDKLSPEPTNLLSPSYIPPQLRPRHALAHYNLLLAAQICETNPLSEEDLSDLQTHFDTHFPPLLRRFVPFSNEQAWTTHTALLKAYIRHMPDYREDPVLRRSIACAATGSPEPDEELLAIAAQLPDGPIHLNADDIFHLCHDSALGFAYNYGLFREFSSKWDDLLGDRLPLALDLSELTSSLLNQLSILDSHALLTHFIFTGSIEDDKWDELLAIILPQLPHLIDSDRDFDRFFQPSRIFTHVPADKLLAILPQLPLQQRARILLHVRTESNYEL